MSDGFRLFTCQRSHGLQKPSDSEPSGPSPHRLGPLALHNPQIPLRDPRLPFGNPQIPWVCPPIRSARIRPPDCHLGSAPPIGPCFAAVQEYRSHRLRRRCRILAAKSAKQIPTAFPPQHGRPDSLTVVPTKDAQHPTILKILIPLNSLGRPRPPTRICFFSRRSSAGPFKYMAKR